MLSTRPLTLLIGASLIAGCTTQAAYKTPDQLLSGNYTSQANTSLTSPPTTLKLEAWWEGFNDPVLTELIEKALKENLDLAQAFARVEQSKAGNDAALAALLPSAHISGQAARSHQSIETPLGQVLNSSPKFNRNGNAYELNLAASWELDLFGSLREQRQGAIAEYQASEAAAVATRLTVEAQTANLYITIRGLQTRLEIAEKQVKTQEALLEKAKLLLSKGLLAEYQVHQAEGSLSQARAALPLLQTRLDAAMNGLDVILGVQPGTTRPTLLAATPIPTAPRIDHIGAPADLLRRRPDLIVAERKLAAANARVGVAVKEYYPQFSISALLGNATAISSKNLFTSGAEQSAGVLGLRWRLFDFGRINAEINQAKGQAAEAIANYKQSALRATEDVENAVSGVINSDTEVTTLTAGEVSIASARQSSYMAFQKGAASQIDVLQADEGVLRASDARAQAQAESALAAVALFKALGGGWDHANDQRIASQ